jgi:hypothetical protein
MPYLRTYFKTISLDKNNLSVQWHITKTPYQAKALEKKLLIEYAATYGELPPDNLRFELRVRKKQRDRY